MIKFLRGFWKRFRKSKNKEVAKEIKEIELGPIFKPKKQRISIQVGLDFGTSATKVAYSVYGTRGTRIIDFGHKLPHFPSYCLPSIAAIDKRGRLLLGVKAAQYLSSEEWDSGFQRFKVLVAGNCEEQFKDPITEEKFHAYRIKNGYDISFTPERLSAIYLAHVMYLAKNYIKNQPEYKTAELDLAFNICMPIDHIENNRVRNAFEKIFVWAEPIYKAWQAKEESLDPIKASEDFGAATIPEAEVRVFGIPEAVAEIASYLVSLRKKEGLHAVVDFGAGTTDISIFNLCLHNAEAGSKSYWHAAKNLPKGTINVERRLSHFLNEKKLQQVCSHIRMRDYLSRLPELCREKGFQDLSALTQKELAEILAGEEYRKTWAQAYKHFMSQTAWENVPIFISGGGSQLPFIRDILSKPWWENIDTPYPVYLIPPTEDYYEDKNTIPFERVAVAYGLAFPKPKLEQYVLPLDSPDQTPVPLPCWAFDRDELYPK